jgi:Kef-type K+ transport system membrane component KefB
MDNGLTTFDMWVLGIAMLLISFGASMSMLTVFRRLRKFAGKALMITAVMLGVTVWLLAADTVISGWTGPSIIGGLVGIIAPLPVVPLIYLMHGDWGNMGFFLALYALTYAGWVGGVKASDTGGG